jgi:multidrug transporter EmrE-like cation transporter
MDWKRLGRAISIVSMIFAVAAISFLTIALGCFFVGWLATNFSIWAAFGFVLFIVFSFLVYLFYQDVESSHRYDYY